MRRGRLRAAVAALALLAAGLAAVGVAPAASAVGTPISGGGSTYVAQAASQWVADGQRLGLPVQYQGTLGSLTGLAYYQNRAIDFTGTEAEISSIYGVGNSFPSYQYVPDVAGATALMYNLRDAAGQKVDYLHLSPKTIGGIFTGRITRWNDPEIRAENLGAEFQDIPIQVVLRSGGSGTTALFYDFVQHSDPASWETFRAKNGLSSTTRVTEIPEQAFGERGHAQNGSDGIAQYIKNDATGNGSIGYDEFGYARFYQVATAWVQNAAGKWVQPYATNISAALDTATLRPDLTQELSTVYTNPNPLAYPASAYSYLVMPCAPAADRPTCKDPSYDPGRVQTMAAWLDYIGCAGQVKMAQLGYSPLPPVLSGEVQKAIARLGNGAPAARTLTAANCTNPRFSGSLGAGSVSPPDPFAAVKPGVYNAGGTTNTPSGGGSPTTVTKSGTPAGAGAGGPSSTAPSAGGASAAGSGAAAGAAGTGDIATAGKAGAEAAAVGGGSTEVRAIAPVAYRGANGSSLQPWAGLLLLVLLAVPLLLRRLRRRSG